MEAENWENWKKKVRLGWRPKMKKNEKKLLGIAIFGCLFTGKDRSIHEWMNGWRQEMTEMETESENVQVSTTHVYKCTYNVEA